MFDHPHHQKIHLILDSLDASIFHEVRAYFGGGTLITLLYDEYRWSKDVDFICPVGPGYRRLRELVGQSHNNPKVFFHKTESLKFPRNLTADHYGVRFLVVADGEPIKFEIVAENRIQLEKHDEFEWTQLPCLSEIDRFAEKLLANADRWNDESIESRDLIDLAVLRMGREVPKESIEKSEEAYPVIDPLKKALQKFLNSGKYRKKCFDTLQIENSEQILQGVELLDGDFP
jgi:predicted nucleotidyltransferase component of viral defense system